MQRAVTLVCNVLLVASIVMADGCWRRRASRPSFHDRYKDQGLSTVWINVVPQEERLIPEWRSAHGYTVPVLIGGRSVSYDYKLTVTPTHFLLDAQANVISRHAGYKPSDGKELEREMQQALARVP